MERLADIIQEVLLQQEANGGIKLTGLEVGTKLYAETRNSIYEITCLGDNRAIEVCGGLFPDPVTGYFIGSTWGTTLLKLDWIGQNMRMEMVVGGRLIDTSPVKNLEIHAPDDSWSYSMDWNNEDQI
jgi:hypothetical protein